MKSEGGSESRSRCVVELWRGGCLENDARSGKKNGLNLGRCLPRWEMDQC